MQVIRSEIIVIEHYGLRTPYCRSVSV
jgi:hypothetical protein